MGRPNADSAAVVAIPKHTKKTRSTPTGEKRVDVERDEAVVSYDPNSGDPNSDDAVVEFEVSGLVERVGWSESWILSSLMSRAASESSSLVGTGTCVSILIVAAGVDEVMTLPCDTGNDAKFPEPMFR